MEPEATRYTATIDLANDNDSHVLMIRMVGGGKRVLDVGCWTGDMGAYLAARNREVVGVELDATAAAIAADRLHRVVVGDFEHLDLDATFDGDGFDVIVFGDVLEHLLDPAAALGRAQRLLRPGGYVVCSIPNVAHGSIRLRLLAGEFRYTEVGLLDRTHLRFFTRQSLEELFESAGFVIVEIRTTNVDPLLAPEAPIDPATADAGIVEQVQADPDAHVYQFVVRAVPDDSDHAIRELYRQQRALAAELDRLRVRPAVRAASGASLLQVGVLAPEHGPVHPWLVTLLGRELSRRLPHHTVVCVGDLPASPLHLRWVDAVVDAGRGASAHPTPSYGEVVGLDLTGGALLDLGPTADHSEPLFGVGLLAARSVKELAAPHRLPMLRLVGAVPPEGHLVLAIDPAAVVDAPGLATVVHRLADRAGVMLLPLAGVDVGAFLDLLATTGAATDVRLLPHDAPLDDVLAVLDSADAVITTDPSLAGVAHSLGRPHALLREDGPEVAALVTSGGGVAGSAEAIPTALHRTHDPAVLLPRLGTLQARVDSALDVLAHHLDAVPPTRATRQHGDPEYVDLLEQTVAALQRSAAAERTALASAFAEVESAGRDAAAGSDSGPELEALRAAADTYRLAIVDLQEQLYAARSEPDAEPAAPPVTPPMTTRRVVAGVLRRLGLRRG